ILSVAAALLSQWIAPFEPTKASLSSRLVPPSWADETGESAFLLGTDQVGRDLLSRIIYGTRISLMVGFLGVLISMVIGTIL
ncbi:ABC transporter permease, partial [Alkalibacillus haloalkaliphilus]|nr:ABC transporter permease [Alkalibacillus haloalkaliphilus]